MKKISVKIEKTENYITLDVDKKKTADGTEYVSEKLTMTYTMQPTNFTQLYVPYDYFKKACQMIQSLYSADNQYAGYHNFMHYWAKNGKWNWICFTTEGDPLPDDDPFFEQVDYTYRATNFWNNFDPSQGLHALASCNDPIIW